MPWYFFLIISVIGFTSMNLLQRIIAVESKNPRVSGIIFNIYAIIITITVSALTGQLFHIVLPSQPRAYFIVAIGIICYGLFERGRFYAAKYLNASILSLIGGISLPISFIGSIFLYHEHPNYYNLAGFIIILISITMVSYEKSHQKSSLKGIILGLGIGSAVGIAIMVDKLGATLFQPSTYSLFVWIFPILILLPPLPSKQTLIQTIKRESWKSPLLATFNVFAYLAFLQAYSEAPATLVLPLGNSTIPTVILSAIILKEKDNLPKKILAAILSIIGIFLLVSTS